MGHYSSNPYGADARASNAIDRKREQERRYMLQTAYKNADDLATRLVQKLLDNKILETTSESTIRELFAAQLQHISDMEEFDLNFKIAPLRSLVDNPNFITLYLTQYVIEDLIDHPKVQDVYGDDLEIYKVIDSVTGTLRPEANVD